MNGSSGSIFSPVSGQAQAISHLFYVSLGVCAIVFAVVAGMIVYSLIRCRWREGDLDPKQIYGNRMVEVSWTVIPLLIVLGLFALTVRAMQVSDPPAGPRPDLIVIGHQWWWEVRYPGSGVVAANEIHIPVGRPLLIQLDSVDVLHEFWAPQLSRKMTTVPSRGNRLWLEADKPGIYQGVCSEFCGTQHAWMRFEIVAEPPERFDEWERRQTASARTATAAAAAGWEIFRQMTCVNCHAIRGTEAVGTAGPDLTHLASRRLIGSGIVENTPENLRRWLQNPQLVKPGVKMPDFYLNRAEIDSLVAFLDTLK